MPVRHPMARLALVACLAAASADARAQQGPGTPASPDPAMDALNRVAILPPKVFEELARRLQESRRAQEEVSNPPLVRPWRRAVSASFAADSEPIMLRTVRGYPTAVTFLDSTGQPFPIHWEMAANANLPGSTDCNSNANQPPAQQAAATPGTVFSSGYSVCIPVKGGNTLVVTPLSDNARGAVTVMLEGGKAPVSLMLHANARELDQNLTVQMDRRGPRARADLFAPRTPLPVTGSETMTAMLGGVPPATARPLEVVGGSPDSIRAWSLNGRLYVRMPGTVISPQPHAWLHGQGDVAVYDLPRSPVVLARVDGQTVTLRFQER